MLSAVRTELWYIITNIILFCFLSVSTRAVLFSQKWYQFCTTWRIADRFCLLQLSKTKLILHLLYRMVTVLSVAGQQHWYSNLATLKSYVNLIRGFIKWIYPLNWTITLLFWYRHKASIHSSGIGLYSRSILHYTVSDHFNH